MLEQSCYGAGNYTLMQIISDTIVYRQAKVAAVCSAPSGAEMDAVVASAGANPKWLAGIANGIATLRPEERLDGKLLCRAASPSGEITRPSRLTVMLLRSRDTAPPRSLPFRVSRIGCLRGTLQAAMELSRFLIRLRPTS